MGDVGRTQVYTAESPVRSPTRLAARMAQNLQRSIPVAWHLFSRELRARYRHSYLGYAWAFLPPIALAGGLTLLKTADAINVQGTSIPYSAFVTLSTVLWLLFVEALDAPISGLNSSARLFARIDLPYEAPILAKLGEVLLNLLLRLPLVVGVFAFHEVPVASTVPLALVAAGGLLLLGVCLGLVLAPMAALFEDVTHGLGLLRGVWLLLTPVVYPLPAGDGVLATLVRWNPTTHVLVLARDLATSGAMDHLACSLLVVAVSLVVTAAAWALGTVALPLVVERLSS